MRHIDSDNNKCDDNYYRRSCSRLLVRTSSLAGHAGAFDVGARLGPRFARKMNAHDHQRGHHKELWETDVALAETRQARLNIDVHRIFIDRIYAYRIYDCTHSYL